MQYDQPKHTSYLIKPTTYLPWRMSSLTGELKKIWISCSQAMASMLLQISLGRTVPTAAAVSRAAAAAQRASCAQA